MKPMQLFPRLSLANSAVSGGIDPRTGERIRPLGVLPNGKIMWPIMGGSEDNDSAGGGGTDDDDDDDAGGEEGKSSEGGKGEEKKDNPQAKISQLEDEKNRQYERRMEAETEAQRLRQENEELKNKDKDDNTKVQERIVSLETEVETLSTALRDTRLENAFLRDNTYQWHNPGRALRLADLSKVDIDTDGTVHGLKEALDSLAKSDDYLLKKEEKKQEKDENKVDTDNDRKNSSKRDKTRESQEAQRAKLYEKYPALRR